MVLVKGLPQKQLTAFLDLKDEVFMFEQTDTKRDAEHLFTEEVLQALAIS